MSHGKINSIKSVKYGGSISEKIHSKLKGEYMEGYEIKTSNEKSDILVLISMNRECCEEFGDQILYCPNKGLDGRKKSKNFINKKITKVKILHYKDYPCKFEFFGGIVLEITTEAGCIYLAIYNDNCVYYPHSFYLKFKDYEDVDEM